MARVGIKDTVNSIFLVIKFLIPSTMEKIHTLYTFDIFWHRQDQILVTLIKNTADV